jgi:ATP-dependent Clp protease protease subunit
MTVPYVIEKGENNQERVYDIYSRMLKDRVIFIKGEFDDMMADAVTAQLLFLESVDNEKDIYLYINSPGGNIASMYSIFDTMNYIKPDVSTLAYGRAASAASFILAAGAKGKRYALPNCDIMIHELSTGHGGKFNDIQIAFDHSKKLYDKMAIHYSEFTGQDVEKIKEDMKRDFYMSSEEAIGYGLIDGIQKNRS